MTENAAADPEARAKLWSLIKEVDVAMMTSAEEGGTLSARPMLTCKPGDDFDGTLWFITHRGDHKTLEVLSDPQVALVYADSGRNTYVSVSGKAELVHDRVKLGALWRDSLKKWFPKGKDDPDLALLRVDARTAEYWDEPSGVFARVFGDTSDHGRVAL